MGHALYEGAEGNGTGKYVNFKVEYKDIKVPWLNGY